MIGVLLFRPTGSEHRIVKAERDQEPVRPKVAAASQPRAPGQKATGVDVARLSGWDIVLAADALPSERYAAEEFQRLFARASGIELPIVTVVARTDRHVFIGPGEAMRSRGVGFSVDDFGRLFVPDVFRFAVNVLDAGGNLITRIGRYGNTDDDGIRLAWGAYVSVSGGRLFISDMANRRVTAVALTAAAEATARVPAAR